MSGRSRAPPRSSFRENNYRRHNPYPPPESFDRSPLSRPRPPRPLHPDVYEEELELQMLEIRRLDSENMRINDDRVSLQRELAAAREEIHRLTLGLGELQEERDMRVRDLLEKGRKMEAEIRAADMDRNEAAQLRAEVKKLDALRQEQVNSMTQELEKAKMNANLVKGMAAEIEGLRLEVVRARSAFEYEKKGNVELVEQRQIMEKNLVSMAREVEKLRMEMTAGDGRNWSAAYDPRTYGRKLSPEGKYSSSYGDGYALRSGVGEKNPAYNVGSGWESYEKSHTAHRRDLN